MWILHTFTTVALIIHIMFYLKYFNRYYIKISDLICGTVTIISITFTLIPIIFRANLIQNIFIILQFICITPTILIYWLPNLSTLSIYPSENCKIYHPRFDPSTNTFNVKGTRVRYNGNFNPLYGEYKLLKKGQIYTIKSYDPDYKVVTLEEFGNAEFLPEWFYEICI